MNFLLWNCQGVGQPRVIEALRDLIKSHNHFVIFLFETKMQKKIELLIYVIVWVFHIVLLLIWLVWEELSVVLEG